MIDLSVRGSDAPRPPVEAWFRVIDQPVLRLVSADLKSSAEITSIAEVFDFARDYLGLLKAAVIASGIVPPGMEGATQPLADVTTVETFCFSLRNLPFGFLAQHLRGAFPPLSGRRNLRFEFCKGQSAQRFVG